MASRTHRKWEVVFFQHLESVNGFLRCSRGDDCMWKKVKALIEVETRSIIFRIRWIDHIRKVLKLWWNVLDQISCVAAASVEESESRSYENKE